MDMKVITRNIPIYFGYFRIVISKDFYKSAKKLNIDTSVFDVSKFSSFVHNDYNKHGISRYTIFINRNNIDASIIAHESVHLVNAVFINSHIQSDRHNDEPQAYLTGWFVKEINRAIKK